RRRTAAPPRREGNRRGGAAGGEPPGGATTGSPPPPHPPARGRGPGPPRGAAGKGARGAGRGGGGRGAGGRAAGGESVGGRGGQARLEDPLLGGLDLVGDAVDRHHARVAVEERERGERVAVARLAHRAGVDQVAHAVPELEPERRGDGQDRRDRVGRQGED